jgi:hypothetical protein
LGGERGRRGGEGVMEAVLARATVAVAGIATRGVVGRDGAKVAGSAVVSVAKSRRRGRVWASVAKLATNRVEVASAATTGMGTERAAGGLIEPDGGVLVDLHVPAQEKERRKAEAATLPKVQLAKVDLQWVHTVAEGWASPLTGFMRQNEYLQALHFNCLRLPDGSFVNMSLPIVLAGATAVTLQYDGKDVAILRKYASQFHPFFHNFSQFPQFQT